MKNNLIEILHLVMLRNLEDYNVRDKVGMCNVLSRSNESGQMCTTVGVNCHSCPFMYSLKESKLYNLVGDY